MLLKQATDMGAKLLYLTGGEPLLREDIGQILRFAKKIGMVTMLGTNGFYLEDKIEQIYKDLDYLRVSIDSLRIHDCIRVCNSAFENALRGIKLAKKMGMNIIINATVTSETIDEMEDLAKFAEDLNCGITLSPLVLKFRGEGNSGIDFSGLLPEYGDYVLSVNRLKEKYPCILNSDPYLSLVRRGGIGYAGIKCKACDIMLSANPQGDIYFPCNTNPVEKINLKMTGELKKVWHSKAANHIRREVKNYNFCKSCMDRCYVLPSLFFSVRGICDFLRHTGHRRRFF